jgi:hypothetical protein
VDFGSPLVDDDRSTSAAALDEPFTNELAKRFVNRRPGGLIVLGEICTRGQNVSRGQVTSFDLQLDVLKNPLIRTPA